MLKKLKELPRKELIIYIACSVVILIGLIFLILGVVADNLSVDSALNKAQGRFPWRYLGLIIIGSGVLVFVITLLTFAKKIDRITDRELRRKQRLSAMMSDLDKQEEIVVSEGKVVESTPKVEEKEAELETKPVEEIKQQASPDVQIKPNGEEK